MATCALFGCPNPPSKDNAHCVKHKSLHKPAVMMKGKAVVPKKVKAAKVIGYCVEYATKKGAAASLCQYVMCFQHINAPVLQLGKICETEDGEEINWFHLACLFAHMEVKRMTMPPIVMKKIVGVDSLLPIDRDGLSALVKVEATARKAIDEQRAKENYLEKESENKFWAISVTGTSTVTRWGPIGEAGFDSTKELGSETAAENWMAKKIKEKEAAGYCRLMALAEGSESEEETSKPVKKSKKQIKQDSDSEEEKKPMKKPIKKTKPKQESEEEEEESSPPPKKKTKAVKSKKNDSDSEGDLSPPAKKSKKPEGLFAVSVVYGIVHAVCCLVVVRKCMLECRVVGKKKKPLCPYGAECWYAKDVEHCRNLSH